MTGAGRDMLTQLATMALVLPRCLGQVLVPVNLTLDPAVHFPDNPLSWSVASGVALLGLLTLLGLRRPVARPVLFLGTVVAWGTALPWVLIPLNVPLSEHRLYGPLAGLSLVVAALWPRVTSARRRRVMAGLVVAVAAVFALLSADRSLSYRNERSLWEGAHAIHIAFRGKADHARDFIRWVGFSDPPRAAHHQGEGRHNRIRQHHGARGDD